MSDRLLALSVGLLLGLGSFTQAADGPAAKRPWLTAVAECCCPAWSAWCPDDYCRKPLPCVPCRPERTCDDYCRKPLPCVPCRPGGTCDDYCPKPLPRLCWPAPSGLVCVPACGVCQGATPSKPAASAPPVRFTGVPR